MTSCVKNLKRARSKMQAVAFLAKELDLRVVPGPKTRSIMDAKPPPTRWAGYVRRAAAEWKAQGHRGSPDLRAVNRRAHELAAADGYQPGVRRKEHTRPSYVAEAAAAELKGATARQALRTVVASRGALKAAGANYEGGRRAPTSNWQQAVKRAAAQIKASGRKATLPEITALARQLMPPGWAPKARAAPRGPRRAGVKRARPRRAAAAPMNVDIVAAPVAYQDWGEMPVLSPVDEPYQYALEDVYPERRRSRSRSRAASSHERGRSRTRRGSASRASADFYELTGLPPDDDENF